MAVALPVGLPSLAVCSATRPTVSAAYRVSTLLLQAGASPVPIQIASCAIALFLGSVSTAIRIIIMMAAVGSVCPATAVWMDAGIALRRRFVCPVCRATI